MDAVALLRAQYEGAYGWLEATLGEISSEQAHWPPPGKANPIVAVYAHVLTGQDHAINGMLKGGQPLFATAWAGRTGLSEPPPPGLSWAEWGRAVRADLGALREYARAVYAATDAYLASLTSADLDRPFDLSCWDMGQQTVAVVLEMMLQEVSSHAGEIACLKGLQGVQGYPV